MAKVSICIPVYNNPQEVACLLDSIVKQDYTDYEVNISDDSTNLEIENLIKAYEKQAMPLKYVHNQKPLGHIFNWNAAIRMATGEFIKIMFSDDWFTNETSLRKFVDLLETNPQADLAFCGSRQVMLSEDDTAVKHVAAEHSQSAYDRCAEDFFLEELEKDYRHLFLGNQIGAPSAAIYRRKQVLFFFDEKSNWASDMFLFMDILEQNPRFAYTKEPLISIGVHEHQYTESFGEKDMRIYNDYRYMYTKYQLEKSEACRAYFVEQFIVKYRTGWREAKHLGIAWKPYWKAWREEQKAMIYCFLHARFGR